MKKISKKRIEEKKRLLIPLKDLFESYEVPQDVGRDPKAVHPVEVALENEKTKKEGEND